MMTMLKETLVTSRDPKGLHAVGLFEAAYNKSKLNDSRAQRLNEHGDEFQEGILKLIAELTVSNQFANEEVRSSYLYPKEYQGPRPISEQMDILAKLFNLSLELTSEYIEKVLPTLRLPYGAEGWFAIPSVNAVATNNFPEVKDPAERYCRSVQLVLQKIGDSRSFYNYREGQITPDHLRIHARTAHALDLIAEMQKGDVLIVAAQLGMRHRGRSIGRACEVSVGNEFGLGSFATGSIVLTHPHRLVRWDELNMDCTGDEFSPDADGRFDEAPYFDFFNDEVEFGMVWFGHAYGRYGSVSGFVPQ